MFQGVYQFFYCKKYVYIKALLQRHLGIFTMLVMMNVACIKVVFSAQQPLTNHTQTMSDVLNRLHERLCEDTETFNRVLQMAFLTHQKTTEAAARLEQINVQINEAEQAATLFTQTQRMQHLEDKIRLSQEKVKYIIDEKVRRGIYAAAAKEKWERIKEMLTDSKVLGVLAGTVVGIVLCYFIFKYGFPLLINYFSRPSVISETSKKSWLSGGALPSPMVMDDLVFSPDMQKQMFDLLSRIKTAKIYDENLPNLLFFGASGTGKTAFAKALAYGSGLDYVLTSGSEFAKIVAVDLVQANDELRKLLRWSKTSEKGVIIFIDEAESLFAHRNFSTTPKATQDLINTFLSLISDKSQKNVMFVLATNHPFKIDDAVVDRMGIKIEFALPREVERAKILMRYLIKFAQEKGAADVEIHPEITQNLTVYTKELKGFSPRAIKFVAEDMIIKARRQDVRVLTDTIARFTLNEAKCNNVIDQQCDKAREKWRAS